MTSRRDFVRWGVAGAGLFGAAQVFPAWILGGEAFARETPSATGRKRLVVVFQRGAMDGLNAVVPFGDRSYYDLRPALAVPPPGKGTASALDLDGKFGLNPALSALHPLFSDGRLAIVEAVGSPDKTRSHFDAQDYMESATPGRKSSPDGWLNRYLQTKPVKGATPFRAVAMTQLTPRAMQGRADVVSMTNISDFTLRAGANGGRVSASFEEMYAQAAADALRGAGRETLEAVKVLKRADPARLQPENGARYPKTRFGDAMRQTAQLMKADIGVEVVFTETGGWDTHVNQGTPNQPFGQLSRLLKEFGDGLGAFYQDLGARMKDTLVLTMTEFGRTARQNGTGGTDHGHAACMFAMGGGVKGGKVYGEWPGLKPNDLYEGRDLAVTTDFRDVFAEVLATHLGASDLAAILPGYQANPRKFLGFLTAS